MGGSTSLLVHSGSLRSFGPRLSFPVIATGANRRPSHSSFLVDTAPLRADPGEFSTVRHERQPVKAASQVRLHVPLLSARRPALRSAPSTASPASFPGLRAPC